MKYNNLTLHIPLLNDQSAPDSGQVATLCLNRPETGNALNTELIAEMHRAFDLLEQSPPGLLMLKASGKHFCTGADLNWMRQAKALGKAENLQDAQQLATLMRRLDQFPAPTVAVIQGAAYGGALGLVTACDMAIASESAKFCLSEVRLGLIPAVISPYVIRAMGARQARRYFLTGETISSQQALSLNLIHELCREQDLVATADALCEQILRNAPLAMVEAKQLIEEISDQPMDDHLIHLTCERIANIRVSREAQEGLSAFLDKRPPVWRKKPVTTNKAGEQP